MRTLAISAIAASTPPTPDPPSRCASRSEEHTSELQSRQYLVCRLLLEKKKNHKQVCYKIIAGAGDNRDHCNRARGYAFVRSPTGGFYVNTGLLLTVCARRGHQTAAGSY